ncbi:glycosyltransferase [soil metagenome]
MQQLPNSHFSRATPLSLVPEFLSASRPLPIKDETFISIIVPVKNESDSIIPFVNGLTDILDRVAGEGSWEIIFVDDGSTDATFLAILMAHDAEPRVRAVSLSRNFGKEAALSAGLDYCRGSVVVPMDVDLQDPPEVIGAMVERWREGADVVYGVRRSRTTDSYAKRNTASLYYRFHNWVSDDKIPEHAGDFRLMDRKVVDAIKRMPERNRFMKGLFAWSGFHQSSVEYDRAERLLGHSKFSYWKLWTLALDGITSASTLPLRIWSYVGGVIAIASFAYALFIVAHTIFDGNSVNGYPSIIVSVMFFGGVQLLSLGVLGEYVGRILVETKQRPIYIVRDQIGLPEIV